MYIYHVEYHVLFIFSLDHIFRMRTFRERKIIIALLREQLLYAPLYIDGNQIFYFR